MQGIFRICGQISLFFLCFNECFVISLTKYILLPTCEVYIIPCESVGLVV